MILNCSSTVNLNKAELRLSKVKIFLHLLSVVKHWVIFFLSIISKHHFIASALFSDNSLLFCTFFCLSILVQENCKRPHSVCSHTHSVCSHTETRSYKHLFLLSLQVLNSPGWLLSVFIFYCTLL